jgi:hypothetical protein
MKLGFPPRTRSRFRSHFPPVSYSNAVLLLLSQRQEVSDRVRSHTCRLLKAQAYRARPHETSKAMLGRIKSILIN